MKKMILRVSICEVDDNGDVADEVEEWLESIEVQNGENNEFRVSEVMPALMDIAALICLHFAADKSDYVDAVEVIHKAHLDLTGQ